MLVFLTLLLALNGGAFAPSFHRLPAPAIVAPPSAPVRFDGTSGNPDHGMPTPPPSPSLVSKVAAPVRYDGTSGNPDHQ
jgi:hypothetical protein